MKLNDKNKVKLGNLLILPILLIIGGMLSFIVITIIVLPLIFWDTHPIFTIGAYMIYLALVCFVVGSSLLEKPNENKMKYRLQLDFNCDIPKLDSKFIIDQTQDMLFSTLEDEEATNIKMDVKLIDLE